MYCNNCGTQNPDGVKFCSNCGGQLLNASAQTASAQPEYSAAPAQPNASYAVTQPEKKKNGKLIGIIAGVAVVVIVAIIVVVIAFIGGKNNDENAGGTLDNNIQQNVGPNEQQNDADKLQNQSDDKVNNAETSRKDMSYQDVSIAFMKAYWEGDFNLARSYCVVDAAEIIVQQIKANSADADYETLDELYADMEEEIYLEYGETVNIDSMDDIYDYWGKAFIESFGDLKVTDITITDAELIDLSDPDYHDWVLSDVCDCVWSGFIDGILSDVFDISKVTEAYEVEITVTATLDDGTTDTVDAWFYVVKYDGVWCVVADPISES